MIRVQDPYVTHYYLKNLWVQRHCIMHHWTTSQNGTRLRYHMPSSTKVVVKNVNRQSLLSLFKIKQGHKYSKNNKVTPQNAWQGCWITLQRGCPLRGVVVKQGGCQIEWSCFGLAKFQMHSNRSHLMKLGKNYIFTNLIIWCPSNTVSHKIMPKIKENNKELRELQFLPDWHEKQAWEP